MTRKRSNSLNQQDVNDYFSKHEIMVRNGPRDAFLQFNQAPLQETLAYTLKKAGFTEPTPIQSVAWPPAFQNKDCLAIAKTGSGKTCGYLMPAMNRILK